MEKTPLRWFRITSKGYKKELLLSKEEVTEFKTKIDQLKLSSYLVINTNIGLDIYYISPTDLALLISQILGNYKIDFDKNRLQLAHNPSEIIAQMKTSFLRISAMPLLFKSYTISLLYQLDQQFEKSSPIIVPLFELWHQSLFDLSKESQHNSHRVKLFLHNLHQLYNQNNYHPLLKRLIKSAIEATRRN